MGEIITPEQFYAETAAKGLALATKPVVPHGLFAEYLEAGIGGMSGGRDVRLGYGALIFLNEQGITGFADVYRRAVASVDSILGGVGPVAEETHEFPPERWHVNAFEPTIPTKRQQEYDPTLAERLETLCDEVIGDATAFKIRFESIVSSDNALILCGYAEQPLADIRARFWDRVTTYPTDFGLTEFGIAKDAGLPEAYQRQKNDGTTAPVTMVRLQGELQNPDEYVDRVERYTTVDLGSVGITQLSFVHHGWHNHPEQRTKVKTYKLC